MIQKENKQNKTNKQKPEMTHQKAKGIVGCLFNVSDLFWALS